MKHYNVSKKVILFLVNFAGGGIIRARLFLIILIILLLASLGKTVQLLASTSLNWSEEKAISQKMLAHDPNDILANFRLAIALVNLGKIEEAYDFFQQISDEIDQQEFNDTLAPTLNRLEQEPDNLRLLNYAAFSSSINQEYDQAINYFQDILLLEPKNIWIMNYMAATYLEQEKYEQARDIVNKAIKIKDNKYSHFVLGMISYKEGNYIKALLEFSRSGNLLSKILNKSSQ